MLEFNNWDKALKELGFKLTPSERVIDNARHNLLYENLLKSGLSKRDAIAKVRRFTNDIIVFFSLRPKLERTFARLCEVYDKTQTIKNNHADTESAKRYRDTNEAEWKALIKAIKEAKI